MFRKLLELSIDQKPPIYKSVRNPFAYTHGNTSDLTKLHHRDAADILSRPKIFELAKCFQTVMNEMFTDTYNFKHISSVEECMTEIEKFIGKYSECDKSCACKKKHWFLSVFIKNILIHICYFSVGSTTRLKTAKNLSPLFLDTFCPSSELLNKFGTTGSLSYKMTNIDPK